MTILFMGGEMPSFLPSDSSVGEDTDLGYYDSSFARCAVSTSNDVSFLEAQEWASQAEIWIHGEVRQSTFGSGTDKSILALYDGADTVFGINKYTDDRYAITYLDNMAVFQVADIDTFNGSLQTIDFYIDIATGVMRLYFAGTKRLEATGLDLAHITGVTNLRCVNNYYMKWSQVVVADEPTIGWRLVTRYPSGAGATSSFTGAYTSIDEIAYSDADFINSATNGHVSTFAQTGPALTGYTVRAVGVYARARCGAGGPQNLQLALRSSGTDYFSSSQALDVGYEPHGNIWETDPATSAAFLNTAIDSLQPGVKAIT